MTFDRRLLTTFIIALILISGAYGKSVSIGRGSSLALSGGSSANGNLVSDGLVTHSYASSAGVIDNLKIDPWVENTKGDYVEIGLSGTNVGGFSYKDNYYPGKGGGWDSDAIWAQQWLSANWADYLNAYSYASTAASDKAKAEITIDAGSLVNYYNAAYAGPAPWLGMDRVASVQQTIDSANSVGCCRNHEIQALTWAVDSVGDAAGASTDVKQGSLNGYSVVADAASYSNGLKAAGVSVDSMSASAPFGSIDQVMCGIDHWGDTSKVSIDINDGKLYSLPYYSGVPAVAYSIDNSRQTYASQSYDAEATGYGSFIDINRYANNVDIPPPYVFYERVYGEQKSWDIAHTGF